MDTLGIYQIGYSARSRYRAMAGPVLQHLIAGADSSSAGSYGNLLCSGAWGIVGNGAGRDCPKCAALAKRDAEDGV